MPNKPAKSVSSTRTLGVPGSVIWMGALQDNEKNAQLQGIKKYETYGNMLANVSIIAAGVRYFLNLISNAGWKVEPADESPQAQQLAENIELIKDRMRTPWRRVIRRAAIYKFYGFGIQEWTAKRLPSGLIAIDKVDPRPQITIEQWHRGKDGEIEFVVQRSPQDFTEITIPRSKLIYMVDDALNDSPEGLGLFRHLAEPARRLQRFEQLEGYGFETDLRGIPIGRAPFAELAKLVTDGTITAEQKTLIEKPLIDLITGHIKNPGLGAVLDSITYQSEDEKGTPSSVKQWDMELLKSGSSSMGEVAKTILRLNEEIARVLNMEGLLLGANGSASLALSQDKSQNLAMIIESTQLEMAEVYNHDFIGTIGQLNGWPEDLLPKFKPEPIRFRDVTEITKAMADLASAGAMLDADDPIINSIRSLLNMPVQLVPDPSLIRNKKDD